MIEPLHFLMHDQQQKSMEEDLKESVGLNLSGL